MPVHPQEVAPEGLNLIPHHQSQPPQQCESPQCFPPGMRWDTTEHHDCCPSPAMSSQWQGTEMKTQADGQPAWSAERWRGSQSTELWVRHVTHGMKTSSVQRQTQRTHDTDNTATLPSEAPLPFLSGISNPVPPDGYRETSVGTGQLLAVSSVISYICPSIGCRCQFRPNRCMAVVSNEKSHLFLPEVETELPSHRGGQVG